MTVAEAKTNGSFTFQEYFTPHKGRRLRQLPHLVRLAVGIVWRSAPGDLVFCASLQIAAAVAIGCQVLVVRNLLTGLIDAQASFSSLLPEIAGLAFLGVIVGASAAVLAVRQRILGQLVAIYATDGLIRTAGGVDLVTYESPGFHDRLQRAQLSASTRPAQMVNFLIASLSALTIIIGIVIAVAVIQPLFCVLVLVAYVPSWLATNHASRLIYQYSVEQTERERLRMYLFELLTSKPSAQEIRAFELGGFLAGRHRELFNVLLEDLREVLSKQLRVSLSGQVLTGLLTAGSLAVLVLFVTSGRMSLAEAGSVAAAMILLTSRLRGLSSGVGGLYESSLYLEDFSSFAAAAPRIEAARPTRVVEQAPSVIAAEGLHFTYPSRTEPSLVDVSLTLRRGEVVALVGENGSGKTTLAKLLAGLYSPEKGTIEWDGVDSALLDPVSVRSHVAVIFQDFNRYTMSAYDNIAFGDSGRFDETAAVERAAGAAGMHDAITTLPEGYRTLLGPEYFGGSDISGGQWQRVALARAFFRDAPIVILDEPTASLDPRAEADLFASMGDLFSDRGVLLISHRFGSVRSADRIYVLRDGRVHGFGSHEELMEANGYYAELFRLQSSAYRD